MAKGLNNVTLLGVVSGFKNGGKQGVKFTLTTKETSGDKEYENWNFVFIPPDIYSHEIIDGATVLVQGRMETQKFQNREGMDVWLDRVVVSSYALVTKASAHINQVIVKGNLGADPEMRYTPQGTAVTSIRVATGDKFTTKSGIDVDTTYWYRVQAWQKTAEFVNEYMHKGDQVVVVGRVATREWTDKDGDRRFMTEITSFDVQACGSRKGGNTDTDEPTSRSRNVAQPVSDDDYGDDDIPF